MKERKELRNILKEMIEKDDSGQCKFIYMSTRYEGYKIKIKGFKIKYSPLLDIDRIYLTPNEVI